jgi:hypothetical protein
VRATDGELRFAPLVNDRAKDQSRWGEVKDASIQDTSRCQPAGPRATGGRTIYRPLAVFATGNSHSSSRNRHQRFSTDSGRREARGKRPTPPSHPSGPERGAPVRWRRCWSFASAYCWRRVAGRTSNGSGGTGAGRPRRIGLCPRRRGDSLSESRHVSVQGRTRTASVTRASQPESKGP